MKGEGNQQDYGMRIYDPRIGRFLSTDPISKSIVDYSPYHFAFDSPIWLLDVDGLYGDPGGPGGSALKSNVETPRLRVVKSAKVVEMKQKVETPPTPTSSPWWLKIVRFSGTVGSAIGWIITPVPSTPLPDEMKGDESYYTKNPQRLRNNFHETDDPDEGASTWEQFTANLRSKAKDSDKDGTITLYRGVSSNAKHPLMYKLAKRGIAAPLPLIMDWERGVGGMMIEGHQDDVAHTGSDNMSIWTSWTSSYGMAENFATGNAFGLRVNGVVLTKTFKKRDLTIPLLDFGESEYLVPGIVTGAKVDHVGPGLIKVPKKD